MAGRRVESGRLRGGGPLPRLPKPAGRQGVRQTPVGERRPCGMGRGSFVRRQSAGARWHTGLDRGLALAKKYNRNYIDGKMTKTTVCYLIDSYYDSLSFANCAAIKANSPWSGHYEVWLPLWAMAHTAQFAQPGWKYLDGGCGPLQGGGSYVSLRSPYAAGDYSVIVETGEAKKPQSLAFRVTGALSAGPLHVWRSSEHRQFVRQDDIPLVDGSFRVTLEPGCIYSLTTTTGQRKGKTEVPPPAEFPLPYRDDFEGYAAGKTPRYFADQSGTFEVAQRPGGGKCLRQTVARCGIDWEAYPTPDPYTIIGSAKWCNYEVACDAYVEKAGYVSLYGRIKCSLLSCSDPPHGYWLKVGPDGRWDLKAFTKTLASGNVPFAANRWHRLASCSVVRGSPPGSTASRSRRSTWTTWTLRRAGWPAWGAAGTTPCSTTSPCGRLPAHRLRGGSTSRWAGSDRDQQLQRFVQRRFANDGDPATRWNAAVGNETGAWLEIDFGHPTRFNRVAVRQLDQRIENYKIQYSTVAVGAMRTAARPQRTRGERVFSPCRRTKSDCSLFPPEATLRHRFSSSASTMMVLEAPGKAGDGW